MIKLNFFSRLYLLNTFQMSIAIFGLGLIYLYFFKLGFSLIEISIYYLLIWVTATTGVLALKFWDYSRLIKASLFLRIIQLVVLVELSSLLLLYFSGILYGIAIILFWVPFNAFYFSLKMGKNRMTINSLLTIVVPITSLVLLPLAGIVAKEHGFNVVFFIAAGFSFFTFMFVDRHIFSKKLRIDAEEFIAKFAKIRSLYLVQGFYESVQWMVIPVVTLQFISDAVAYGHFLSFLVFFSILGSLFIARLSDKMKNRAKFAMPILFIIVITTFFLGVSNTFEQWTLFNAILALFLTMIAPFFISLVSDTAQDIDRAVVARELFLSIGRVVGGIVILAFAYSGDVKPTLIVAALVFLLYPILMSRNLKKMALYKYSRVD